MKWSVMVNDKDGTKKIFEDLVGESVHSFLGYGIICGVDSIMNSDTKETANLVRFRGNLGLFLNQFFACNVRHNTNPIFFGWPDNIRT